MIHHINHKDFLKYIKTNYPQYLHVFSKKNSFLQKVLNIFYSQQLLLEYLKNTTTNTVSLFNIENITGSHKDNYLLIPINIDDM